MQNYKNKNIKNLKLKLSESKDVELYNSNNELIRVENSSEIDLDKVSYIRLVGKGTLGHNGKHGLKIIY